MGNKLKNKVAIITGGGRGIGKAIAKRFAKEGYYLMLVARTETELEKAAAEIIAEYHTPVLTRAIDISNEQAVQQMVKQTVNEFGKIDVLVNNAGIIGPMGELSEISSDDFVRTFKINAGGMFNCTKAAIPYMKKQMGGCIINLSGGGGLRPLPYFDAYAASKAAIVRLTENFAIELEEYNILITAIAPGAVNTKMFDEQLEENKESIGNDNWKDLQNRLESGGDSIDMAPELALFIANSHSKIFNGRVISAIWDDWKNIPEQSDMILDTDIYKMRRIVPEDRKII